MKLLTLCAGSLFACPAFAAVSSVDLSNYQLSAVHNLNMPGADEASAVAYNPDTHTLFVIDDEGDYVAEFSTTGQALSHMALSGFNDVEGITYLGSGSFALTEERLQNIVRVSYTPNTTTTHAASQVVNLGPNIGNIGLEGVCLDPLTGNFIIVKEKSPQAVYEATLDFPTASGSKSVLFTPSLGVADLSDVAVLSAVPSLLNTPDQNNLLIISQESQRLLEVSRTGTVLSSFSFASVSWTAEGVTIAPDGTIYVVAEADTDHNIPTSRLYVLSPVPEPASLALLSLSSLLLASRRHRNLPPAV